jgi:hypothetical protein
MPANSQRLTDTHSGYCALTSANAGNDCVAGAKGTFTISAHAHRWEAAERRCEHLCRQCTRCRFYSFSLRHHDCSWFADCDLSRLLHTVTGFRTKQLDLAVGSHAPRDESSHSVMPHHSVPLYTPADHPLCPSAPEQRLLEWEEGLPTAPSRKALSHHDVFTRHFPVQSQYFAKHSQTPCNTALVQAIVPTDSRCDGQLRPAVSWTCIAPSRLARRRGCEIWTIGSTGHSCWEEYVHRQAGACTIRTFDPSLSRRSAATLQGMQRRGVMRYYSVGLGAADGIRTIRTYGSVGVGSRCEEWQMADDAARAQAREPTFMGCVQMRVRPLSAMMASVGVTWIDYLKIDCEGCEMEALPRFLNDSMARWGHVPVTQLQIEIHVGFVPPFRRAIANLESYGARGLLHNSSQFAESNHPQILSQDLRARELLTKLQLHGFVPFHIHFGETRTSCCAAEYSFYNTRTPAKMLPPRAPTWSSTTTRRRRNESTLSGTPLTLRRPRVRERLERTREEQEAGPGRCHGVGRTASGCAEK